MIKLANFGREHRLLKMVKWIQAIEFVESTSRIQKGEGGYNEDHEYFGELVNIWPG